jgi:hypothetical protein
MYEGVGQKKESKKLNIGDILSIQNKYRHLKPAISNIRKEIT